MAIDKEEEGRKGRVRGGWMGWYREGRRRGREARREDLGRGSIPLT